MSVEVACTQKSCTFFLQKNLSRGIFSGKARESGKKKVETTKEKQPADPGRDPALYFSTWFQTTAVTNSYEPNRPVQQYRNNSIMSATSDL